MLTVLARLFANSGGHTNSFRQTLPVTPAMAVGIADHVWSTEEIVGLLR